MQFTRGAAALLAVLVAAAGCETMGQSSTTTPPQTGTPPASTEPARVVGSERGVIPVGQQLDVRLQDRLSSDTATLEQRFDTTTAVDLMQDGAVLVPAGSIVRGTVATVEPAGRIDRTGRMTLNFDEMVVRGRTIRIRALPTQAFESGGIRDEATTVGAGGVAGAIVGGLLGGVRGALIGAAIGAGGVVAATEGKDVVLPAGSIIRLRFDQPVRVG